MKKRITICLAVFMLLLTACGNNTKSEDSELDVAQITVLSNSIDDTGKLFTVTAANKQPNNPLGSNQSPALSWDAVDGATYYAVCMFDDTANWLHFFVTNIEKTMIEQGEYTSHSDYVGPYPPKGTRHKYRIEVFALKQKPDNVSAKLDANNSYANIVKSLDEAGDTTGNVLARGYIIGTYSNGDNTVK